MRLIANLPARRSGKRIFGVGNAGLRGAGVADPTRKSPSRLRAFARWATFDLPFSRGGKAPDRWKCAVNFAPRPPCKGRPPPGRRRGGSTDARGFGRVIPCAMRRASTALQTRGRHIWSRNLVSSRMHCSMQCCIADPGLAPTLNDPFIPAKAGIQTGKNVGLRPAFY